MADMMNKTVLFLAVNGFEARAFETLWSCFGNLNASTRIASFNADDEIKSVDGIVNTRSDMSFNDAAVRMPGDQPLPDVVVIADNKTAEAILNDDDALTVIRDADDRGAAIVAIDDGVKALIAADVISGRTVAAPRELSDELQKVGARLSEVPLAVSDNVFTAISEGDLMALCNLVSDYITSLEEEVA